MNWKKDYPDEDRRREIRNAQRSRYYRKSQGGENSRQPYTLEEIDMILAHEIPDTEIAKKLGRSVQAIQGKRWKLQKGDDKNSG